MAVSRLCCGWESLQFKLHICLRTCIGFNVVTPKNISIPRIFLIFILALLVIVYAHGFFKLDDISHLGMSGLYFLAVAKLVSEKKKEISYQTSLLSGLTGLVLLAGVLGLAFVFGEFEVFWRMMPFVCGFGLVFLVSQFNLRLFWKELVILFFLGAPKLIIGAIYNPSALTAKASSLMLWYLGFDAVIVDKIYVMLPTGGIKVYEGCSGLETVCYTLGLAVVLMLIYPVAGRWFQASIPIVAIGIGFVVNLIRVVLLAILNAYDYKDAFVYWHERNGSLIFGMVAVLALGAFHYFLPQPAET